MKRLLSFVLCIIMLLGMSVCVFGAEETWVDSGIDYAESLETINNPGVGYSPGAWCVLGTNTPPTKFSTGIATPKFDLSRFSAGNDYTQGSSPSVAVTNPERVGGEDKEIDAQTLAQLEATFSAAEKQGIQMIPRFAYTWSDCVGCEPSEMRWIIRHIEQVCELINRYKDTVISVECGTIGPWGEMHSSKYQGKQEANLIIDAWLTNLDESITLQVRTANFIINYAKSTDIKLLRELPFAEDHPAYRLGMYNDGYLGNAWDYGTWGKNTMSRENGILLLGSQNDRIPYGGELAYASLAHVQGTVQGGGASPIYSDTFVKELYDTHLSYLSNIVANKHTIVDELEKLTFSEKHAFDGMPNVSAYYGQTLRKFMHDHMGYRYVLREAQTTGTVDKGRFVTLRGEIENVGFGNLLAGMTAEVILVDANGGTTVVAADIDPRQWKTSTTSSYDICLSVPKDAESGNYNAYLRFGTLGVDEAAQGAATIQFSNNGIWFEQYGANYIGSFTVTDTVSGNATEFAQVSITFDDVSEDFWGRDAIEQICNMGLMKGLSETTFGPNNTTTRGQFVTVLYNLEGQPSVAGISTPFTDVPVGKYYTNAVSWAYDNEIVNGTTDTTFDANAKITRQQFATMLYRYAQFKGVDVSATTDISKYEDEGEVGNYAIDAMKWANAEGYITGVSATTLKPKNNATRAQMATILMRYIEKTAQQ